MDLHDADRFEIRNGEGIRPALDDHDAGNEPGVEIIFLRAGDNCACNAAPVALVHVIFLKKCLYRGDGGVRSKRNRYLQTGFFDRLNRPRSRKYESTGGWETQNKNRENYGQDQ